MEVVGELEGVSESDGGPVDLVDASYGFLGVPGCTDFSVGITGVEETTQACPAPVADTFGSGCQEASYPIERVSFAAPVPEGFVLDPSAYFVESLIWRGGSHGKDPRLAARWAGLGRRPCDRDLTCPGPPSGSRPASRGTVIGTRPLRCRRSCPWVDPDPVRRATRPDPGRRVPVRERPPRSVRNPP